MEIHLRCFSRFKLLHLFLDGHEKRVWKLALGWHGIEEDQLSEQSPAKQTLSVCRNVPIKDVAFLNPLSGCSIMQHPPGN